MCPHPAGFPHRSPALQGGPEGCQQASLRKQSALCKQLIIHLTKHKMCLKHTNLSDFSLSTPVSAHQPPARFRCLPVGQHVSLRGPGVPCILQIRTQGCFASRNLLLLNHHFPISVLSAQAFSPATPAGPHTAHLFSVTRPALLKSRRVLALL